MTSPRSSEEQWELLLVTIDLATGFELVLVACATNDVRNKLRARLRHECARQGRPFLEPEQGEDGLDWLTRLRGTAADAEGPLPVLFYPVPTEEERETFVLHRLNENRDNLRSSERGIRGMLILAGGPKLLERAAREAPDLWSVRARSFELSDLDLPPDLSGELAAQAEDDDAAPVVARPFRYDAFLSCAHNDRQAIGVLRKALKLDGVENTVVDEEALPGEEVGFDFAAAESRCIVFALSTDFVREVWPKAEKLFADDASAVRRCVILLTLRPCVPPAELRSIRTLDWTTPARRAAAYPELLALLSRAPGSVRNSRVEERASGSGIGAKGGQEGRELGSPPAGLELVAEKTIRYSATRVWGRRIVLVLLVVAVIAGVREALTLYRKVALVRGIFPEFGAGILSPSLAENRVTIRKPFGIGSADLRDAGHGGAPDLTLEFRLDNHYEVFNVSLTDEAGETVHYQCTDASAPNKFVLGHPSDSPNIDLGRVERVDMPLPRSRAVPTVWDLPQFAKRRDSDAVVCPLVKDKAMSGPPQRLTPQERTRSRSPR